MREVFHEVERLSLFLLSSKFSVSRWLRYVFPAASHLIKSCSLKKKHHPSSLQRIERMKQPLRNCVEIFLNE